METLKSLANKVLLRRGTVPRHRDGTDPGGTAETGVPDAAAPPAIVLCFLCGEVVNRPEDGSAALDGQSLHMGCYHLEWPLGHRNTGQAV